MSRHLIVKKDSDLLSPRIKTTNLSTIIMIYKINLIVVFVIISIVVQTHNICTGAALGALGPSAAPVMRSITSKLVPASERGLATTTLELNMFVEGTSGGCNYLFVVMGII